MSMKIFKSLDDRQNISNAYNSICESASEGIASQTTASSTSNSKESSKEVYVEDFLATEFPNLSDEDVSKIENAIADGIEADDIIDSFEYTVFVDVDFHVENDGIGAYEWWGHTEYDRGHDYPVADDYTDGSDFSTPDGTEAYLVSDESEIDEQLNEKASDYGLTYDDEDGHGSYSSFSIPLRYKILVKDPQLFAAWVDGLVGRVGESYEDDGSDESVEEEQDVDVEADNEETVKSGWAGRGKDVDWNYVDVLKYTKSFMEIKNAVDDILYHKLWDMQFSEGENRKKVFDEAREQLDKIRKEAGKWSPNEFLPGYKELIADIEKIAED